MTTKRLGAAKKRRRSSTLIANPRRKKRSAAKRKTTKRKATKRASATKRAGSPKRRRRNPAAKRRKSTVLAKSRNPSHKRRKSTGLTKRRKSTGLAKRRTSAKRRRNPSAGDKAQSIMTMLKSLPILEIAAAGAGAIFISNLVAGVPFIATKVNAMEEGTAKDVVGGLVGPAATFGTAIAIMHFGRKNAYAKKIGQFMAYAALFQATNAIVGKQVQKGVASVLKSIASEEEVPPPVPPPVTTPDAGGFGGAWISPNKATYGGLLGAGAYFSPSDDDFNGAYMSPDSNIKISGFGGFN